MPGRQLPVWSPLGLASIAGAVSAMGAGDRERESLRRRLQDRLGAEHVLLVGGGTQALQIALVLATGGDAARRRPIALPAYSCFDLVTAAVGADVDVRFYDVDPVTLAPDLESLRSVLAQGVAAVVAGNLYGYPVDASAIRDICRAADVHFIEDAAQGIGGISPGDRPAGSLGDGSILSFGRGKGWTGGGGGALLLRGVLAERWHDSGGAEPSLDVAEGRAGLTRALTSSAAWVLGRPSVYWIPSSIPALGLGETHWRDPEALSGIPTFSAALALRTADGALRAVEDRRAVAMKLLARLAASSEVATRVRACVPLGGSDRAGFLRLPVVAASSALARSLCRRGRDLGVAPGYPVALHRLPQAEGVQSVPAPDLPGAECLAERLVTLPVHRWVREPQLDALLRLIESA